MQPDETTSTRSEREAVPSDPMRLVELPEQQRRVVGLIARAYTVVEIAAMLGLKKDTVANHRRAAMLRLGVHSSVGLVHYAILKGLVQPGELPGDSED